MNSGVKCFGMKKKAIVWSIISIALLIIIIAFYNNKPWYVGKHIILHALGSVRDSEGKVYTKTNSLEALEQNYAAGYRVFETDFLKTSDGKIVLCHDWDSVDMPDINSDAIPTVNKFMNNRIMDRFTPMDAGMLIDFVINHPDIYIVTDMKISSDGSDRTELLEDLVAEAKDRGADKFLDRLIVQFYFKEDLSTIKKIYPFKNYIFTLYATGFDGDQEELSEILEFCSDNDVHIITMWDHLWDVKYRELFRQKKIIAAVHTINDVDDAALYIMSGAMLVYSDELRDEDIVNSIGLIDEIKLRIKQFRWSAF